MPADVRPKGKGSPAQFSWQTILVLRVAILLRERFKLELQAHKASLAGLRKVLRANSFIALWGQRIALSSSGVWSLVDGAGQAPENDALLIHLDPHLRVLADGFALPDVTSTAAQLDLFSLPNMHDRASARPAPRPDRSMPPSARRSA